MKKKRGRKRKYCYITKDMDGKIVLLAHEVGSFYCDKNGNTYQNIGGNEFIKI
ncbi:hypothetical protein J6Y73_02190 [bacterium]|nr:hypothetical protein [bacterium]